MTPEKLYIENFLCYDKSYIDFSEFNSAVIVGRIDHNDLFSNGVGKTTIFKAIEYVLFNQADVNLEKLIRDETEFCKIVMDFSINDEKYRISRTRTSKGNSDISLFQKTSEPDSELTYHTLDFKPLFDSKYWKDLSGRRAGDTEKDIVKLIKINLKSFRSTIHFMQNDFTGLTTSTPEKRKAILKEALNLAIYSKIEKFTKDKASALVKEMDKNKVLFDNFGNPQYSIDVFKSQIIDFKSDLSIIKNNIDSFNTILNDKNNKINELNNGFLNLKANFADLKLKESKLEVEKSKLETSIKEYSTKTTNIKSQILALNSGLIKTNNTKINLMLMQIDFSKINEISTEVLNTKELVTEHNILIKNNMEKYNELIIPLPDDSICKHCRQTLSDEHKTICQKQILNDISNCKKEINASKSKIIELNNNLSICSKKLQELQNFQNDLNKIDANIIFITSDIVSKQGLYDNYFELLNKFSEELLLKNKDFFDLNENLEKSSIKEAELIEKEILSYKVEANNMIIKINDLVKQQNAVQAKLAVAEFNHKEKNSDLIKKAKLQKIIFDLEQQYKFYPDVIQAFSSTGIPNLIIQNVLDNLQSEANLLLNQLKPGLQLLFIVEKTQANGTEADTLDIKYFVQSKERYYEQLSGAMKLAVTFSLKLGLSFLLQKMLGVDIKFLLLDEIDQSLDKASIDAFADIIKVLQKDYTILIITHNDRVKDKFSNKIIVEQDINGVSRAKVTNNNV